MDEDTPPPKHYPLSPAKMSKTPSWVMLGFVLGALFVAALPPLGRKVAPSAVAESARPVEFVKTASTRPAQPISTLEAVFAEWGGYAVWSEDITEVALWSSADRAFTDCYEVRRIGGTNYFRSIPGLTRRVISHGVPLPESPLRFTETEEQYREWVEHGRTERPVERDLRPRTGNVTTPMRKIESPKLVPVIPPPLTPAGERK